MFSVLKSSEVNIARRSRNQMWAVHILAGTASERNISARLATNLRISNAEDTEKGHRELRSRRTGVGRRRGDVVVIFCTLWAALFGIQLKDQMVAGGRVELPTPAFSGPRSTGELPRHRGSQRFYGRVAGVSMF